MSKFWKRILVIVAALFVLVFAGFRYMKMQTKKHSPEETVTYYLGGADSLQVEVTYSRPYKKGRLIFGGLVPYGKVWRTGANEATTFMVSKDVHFGGKPVKAGTYTLWTLPEADTWTVYLNRKMYSWGVDFDGNAQRDPAFDVAAVQVPVVHDSIADEQFLIHVTDPARELVLEWDDVKVTVPITN